MSVKSSVIDLLNSTKAAQQAAVGQVYDNMVTSVQALPDDVDGDVTALQNQVTSLTTQLQQAKDALTSEDAALAQEKQTEATLQATIDAVKAALGLVAAPVSGS